MRYKKTIISLILFEVLLNVTTAVAIVRTAYTIYNDRPIIMAFSPPGWSIVFALHMASLFFVQLFAHREQLKPVKIIARVHLGIFAYAAVSLAVYCLTAGGT